MKASNRKRVFLKIWKNISLFWKFQTFGWLMFLIASLPLKWVVLGTLHGALLVSIYREGMGFLTTWGMREIYRRWYRPSLSWIGISALIFIVSGLGATVQAFLALGFHDFIDFEEERIFKEGAVFAIIYFRVAICLAWSFLYFGIKLWRETSEKELRLATIESGRRGAELQKLRAQMNPHFLFNALNSIRAGIENPKIDLKNVVESLAEYLRFSLENRRDDLVSIKKEYDAIGSYFEVEKVRFRDDLQIERYLEESVKGVLVPGIFLQPLVENAIKYGRKTSPRPLRVRVIVEKSERGLLRILVANTGRWQDAVPGRKLGGVGLANLRNQLELLYPNRHRFEIHAEGGWVTICILVPIDYDSAGPSSNHC